MKRIILLFPLVLLSACVYDTADSKLIIVNSTKNDLYVIEYDTSSLVDYPNEVLNLDRSYILKDSIKKMTIFNRKWDNYVKNARNQKLNLFLILPDTMNKYSKDEIIKDEKYLKILSYDLKELNKIKWKVVIKDSVLAN